MTARIRTGAGRPGSAPRRPATRAGDAEDLVAALLAAALDAVVVSRGDGRILEISPTAEQMFGIAAHRVGHLRIWDLIDVPAPATERTEPILAALGERLELTARRLDGTTFPVELGIRRVGSRDGAVYAIHVRDLSAQRGADSALAEERRRLHEVETLSAMGSLLAGVAHELNNPLAILVAQSTVLRDLAPDPDVARRAERICTAAHRAGRIVKGFLAMTRQRAPMREAVDIEAVVDDALDLVRYGLRGSGIALRRERDPVSPRVHADRDLIGQVVVNLLMNAQQAVSERTDPRVVAIACRSEGDRVRIEIADNGAGVPPGIVDRIFDPYFTTRRPGTALGVGLSLCRSILASHGGTIEAGLSPEGWTLFRATLPGLAPGPVGPAADSDLSILVVDDEADVAQSLAELIELLGHRVAVETCADAALDLIRRQTFDVAFVDLRMPGIDGLAMRRAIAAIDPPLMARTVIVTGDTISRRVDASPGDDGRELFLEKPFTLQDVRSLLERVAAS